MKFRDVSTGLRILRDFLLGIRVPHQLHNRFNPLLAPRTLPRPEIPRGPEQKYSDVYYCDRNPIAAVKPPVVAPIALGLKQSEESKQLSGKQEPGAPPSSEGPLVFPNIPAPGPAYWWDGHCYYEAVPDPPPKKACPPPPQDPPPCTPPSPQMCPPVPPTCNPCASANPCEPIKKCK